jgi:hypothetical protein
VTTIQDARLDDVNEGKVITEQMVTDAVAEMCREDHIFMDCLSQQEQREERRMSEIGSRSGRVAPGIYRWDKFRVEKIGRKWTVLANTPWAPVSEHQTLVDAHNWCRRQKMFAKATGAAPQ